MTEQSQYSDGSFCAYCLCHHDENESDKGLGNIQVSIVIPIFNEEESIDELLVGLHKVLNKLMMNTELILVDDSSTDESASKLNAASNIYELKIITLHKNSGHANAIWCGMKHAEGEVIITMDGDLQHPPELIPFLISEVEASKVDVVYAIRNDLVSERRAKRITSHVFFFTFRYVFGLRLVPYANDFRLIKRSYFNSITSKATRVEIMRALLATRHHSFKTVGFDLQARKLGESKFTFRKMLNLYLRTLTYVPWGRSVLFLSLGLLISGALLFLRTNALIHPLFAISLAAVGISSLCLAIIVLSFKSFKKI
jgi:glycosyltransferase involved in cell wall biosynthesis